MLPIPELPGTTSGCWREHRQKKSHHHRRRPAPRPGRSSAPGIRCALRGSQSAAPATESVLQAVHKLRLPRNLRIKIYIMQPCQGDSQQEHFQRQRDAKTQLSLKTSCKNKPHVRKSRLTAHATKSDNHVQSTAPATISQLIDVKQICTCHEKSTLDHQKMSFPRACHEK